MEKNNSPSQQNNSQFTVSKEVIDVQIGDYALLQDCPCKITEIYKSKTGKFGISKFLFIGVDIFTGKKYEGLMRESFQIEIPIIIVTEYQLIGVSDDGYVALLDDSCQIKEDLTLPYENEELTQQIKNGYSNNMDMYVEVTQTMGKQVITSLKTAP